MKINPRSLVCICFLFCFSGLKAQNLIMNPDFEDVNLCHERNGECCPEGWLGVHKEFSDYINKNNRYMSLLSAPTSREYLQTQFLCDLEEGVEYDISIKVKWDDCLSRSLGIFISEQIYFRLEKKPLNLEPSIDFSEELKNISKKNREKWITLTASYLAKGGEKFLMIGDFNSDTKYDPLTVNTQNMKLYKYAIDEIYVIRKDTVSTCEYSDSIKKYWYRYNHRHGPLNFIPYIHKKDTSHSSIPIRTSPQEFPIDSLQFSEAIFEFNSSELSSIADSIIREKFDGIETSSIKKIIIEGHTDNIGNKDYNLTLSLKRAESVKSLLMEYGIPESTIFTEGKGDQFPIDDNSTDQGRKANRRIEIKIIYH